MAPFEGKFAEAQRRIKYRSKKKNILRRRKRNHSLLRPLSLFIGVGGRQMH